MSSTARLSIVIARTAEHWAALHQIRRLVLWEARGRFDYDAVHPDDYLPSNLPLLLLSDNIAVATVRLDLLDDCRTAAFRRLAVMLDRQRQGFGRALMERAETLATEMGRDQFVANVAPDALPFWTRMGYKIQDALAPTGNPVVKKRFVRSDGKGAA